MRIGELGEQAGVSTRTLRHYESLGLLPDRRSANGYRVYDEQDLAAVTEIRLLVELGFALEDTRPFVDCLRSGSEVAGSCTDSLAGYRRKIAEVDGYLAELTSIRGRLQAELAAGLLARSGTAHPQCAFTATTLEEIP